MLKSTIFLVFIILLLSGIPAQAQLREARKEMALFEYSKAIISLQKAVNSKDTGTSREAAFLMAECYRKQNDPHDAGIWYRKSMVLGNDNPEVAFRLAQALRTQGEYSEAKRMFLKYDSLLPGSRQGLEYAAFCDSAVKWKIKRQEFSIENAAGLNTSQSDFGLVPYLDGYLFVSDRFDAKKTEQRYEWTGNDYLRLYYTKAEETANHSKSFASPGAFGELSGKGGHNGPVSFNNDFTMAFINRTTLSGDKGKKEGAGVRTHLLQIFTSVFSGGTWSEPVPFFLNNENFSVGHPALSPDGQTLFFVSDMPGGYGGTDLYSCRMENGKWGGPVNPGRTINSNGNEMFPFVDNNGDLYYSSDGFPGFGGLDLFVTRKTGRDWTIPVNLGPGLNSSYDDFSLVTTDRCRTGFFSTNRPGGKGSDDIWSFAKIIPARIQSPLVISGCVKDKRTGIPVRGATVFLLDSERQNVLVLKTDEAGFYKAEVRNGNSYIARAVKSYYLPDCLPFAVWVPDTCVSTSVPRDLLLDKLDTGRRFILENIFYDFDKWDIRADAKPGLDHLVSLMRDNPVNVELGSHTDCRGSEEYNLVLSRKRAESAVSYIIQQGIGPERITARGYGKSQLINTCNCTTGKDCTEPEHQANRRTEFRITGFTEKPAGQEFEPDQFSGGEVIIPAALPSGFFTGCDQK